MPSPRRSTRGSLSDATKLPVLNAWPSQGPGRTGAGLRAAGPWDTGSRGMHMGAPGVGSHKPQKGPEGFKERPGDQELGGRGGGGSQRPERGRKCSKRMKDGGLAVGGN